MHSDYVIIGSGINSLVAAAELAGAGASVTLLEQHEKIGGFIDSGELTLPGFIHDTYSSWHPLFVSGPGYAALGEDLHRHGLRYRNTEDAGTQWVTASIGTDAEGRRLTSMATRDPKATADLFENDGDRLAYLQMMEEFGAQAPVVFGALGSEMTWPALAKLGFKALRMGVGNAQNLVRQALMSGRNYTRSRFAGTEADQLWAPWLLHAGLGPEQASGGIMLPVMAASMHQFGLPVVEGGAGNFLKAFEALLIERGVKIHTGTKAEKIGSLNGGVRTVSTDRGDFTAQHAVLASASVPGLYEDLLGEQDSAKTFPLGTGSYLPGRAAMQIHLALDAPVPWSDERLATTPLVHLGTGSNSTAIACAQAEAGLLPAEPTIVVGQQCVLDSSRAPEGKATLWIQLQEVPFAPKGDAAGELDTSQGWSDELVDRYVDRVLARIEAYAPGFKDLVLARKVISPAALAQANPNAVAGDPYGGSAELFQNLLWRPMPAAGRGRQPVKGVWHIGAASHPGPGLGGGSGHLAAQQLIRAAKRRRK
ncbi:dehydrogenase [Glutamicibacter soli]|uniref:Pyridine nucleotide-disulfide oxidoreductase domain-containing protein 2 n=1 Tax=Glutamicibacter soli TaxID=453836 RepID=A0A365YKQ3_9MICC|nr:MULTISPECIES: NAD(P)/FAD-dependent oxidoreductase [Micrococcaceae]RBM02623.1 dehydrogenase [Glutamicibacter soli]RKS20674.1 phytoene dehydrogenase-like protein [Arthrobacter sp. AG1021]